MFDCISAKIFHIDYMQQDYRLQNSKVIRMKTKRNSSYIEMKGHVIIEGTHIQLLFDLLHLLNMIDVDFSNRSFHY